jgi:membrane protein implicated in regulation of membrane protease activity
MRWGSPRLLLVFTLATLATVGVIVVLATGSWWALPIAIAGHVLATAIAVVPIFRALDSGEKPDPVDEAEAERAEESSGGSSERDGDEPRMAI